ncbi:MAG TPA: choice-of-anchor Q domain-containing protein [Candidatus Paceibacterota bacterium]|nr:choice-of-anchor Q domain-containing protein [Candidatus Paceibacterota bacterium]
MKSKQSLFGAVIFLACVAAGQSQPVITNQPRLLATALGSTATFTVGARGAEPLVYQWQKDLSDLPGRTNAVLALTNVQISDQADYRVVVSDVSGSVTSAAAHLYVMSFAAATSRTVLDSFDDNRQTGWVTYGTGALIESNQQFTVRGYWPSQHTSATYDTFCFGGLPTSYRTVGQGQTLEWRVDLIHLDDNATNSVKFILGTESGVYGFFKWPDFIALDKYPISQVSLFSFDKASIRNTNVILAFALTRVGLNVILTARVLDKDNPNLVLYERSVVDTPGSDPTLTTADVEALSGMRLAFGPEGSGAPYTYAGAGIGLFQYTDGTRPAATVTYDNLELWTYRLPTAHYVDVNGASPTPPYTNWATAARVIQDAVDAALPGDEIVVTNGLYATGGRAVGTNLLVNRVAVEKPLTLRSVNGHQFTVIQGYQVPGKTNGDGAIRCVYLADGASLSGFTLTNGATRNDGDWGGSEQCGGGIWCESTNALVSHCNVIGNSASSNGGGVDNGTLYYCTLTGNSAGWGGGAARGNLNNCTLTDNSASSGGGVAGGLSGGGLCVLNNCALARNSAQYRGGGAAESTLNNCTLTGNSAQYRGGGVAGGSLNNCTLVDNWASSGGGVSEGVLGSPSTLKNCIVYFNTATDGANYGNYWVSLDYCCTTPLPTNGVGNISLDPQLASASHLSANSPCRGAGSAAYTTGTDIDGEPWANPPSIGCDEYIAETVTGPLKAGILATYTMVAENYPVRLVALTEGRTTASVWDFGDGVTATNQPCATHAWAAPGDYAVVLWAYNDTYSMGVSATVTVHVMSQPVFYVAADSTNPVLPFASWATAATSIQDAVDAVSLPPGVAGTALVLVTNGTYATGGRVLVGSMTNRVLVDKPLTVRSVNGPEFTVIQGYQVPGQTNGDGAIRCAYLTNGATLSGFTLTQGATRVWAAGIGDDELSGGGIWCESYAIVSNCVLVGNSADRGGGGVAGPEFTSAGAATLTHCTLATNSALFAGGAFGTILEHCTLIGNSASSGGGVYLSTLNNCTLTANSAAGGPYGSGGGAAQSILNNCTLARNSAERFGGGALSEGEGSSGCTLNNCTLIANSARYEGGGSYHCTLNNCTLVGNSAGGFYGDGGGGACMGTLNNCIVYFNTAPYGANYSTEQGRPIALNYCCTTPLPAKGLGNITNAPLFVDPANGNLRLQSNSPCINAGLNAYAHGSTDLDGLPRLLSGTIDIGAYEFQGTGSVIAYAWLQQYGLSTDGSADATDPDDDGLNTWQEWRCQTNPTNAMSVLRLLSPVCDGTNVTVRWESRLGISYVLERSSDLGASPSFMMLTTNLPGQPGTTSFTDTNAPSLVPLFYRVGVSTP